MPPSCIHGMMADHRRRSRATNPRRAEVDVDIEPETLAVWDEGTAPSLALLLGGWVPRAPSR